MREFRTIETEKYEKIEGTGMVRSTGMITAQEAFDHLKKHLSENGLLPDEYFIPSSLQDMSQELPDFRTAVCHTDWGGSEGIYIDIYLEYSENRERKLFPFATGKTLDDSGDAFLRMSRISAECSLMLNGRGFKVKVSEHNYAVQNEATQEKPSLLSQIQSAEARTEAPAATYDLSLTKQEFDIAAKAIMMSKAQLPSLGGFFSEEVYKGLKDKLAAAATQAMSVER